MMVYILLIMVNDDSYSMVNDGLPSGELTFCHGKIHLAINGKIHYFYGHFPWQNVSSPEGTKK